MFYLVSLHQSCITLTWKLLFIWIWHKDTFRCHFGKFSRPVFGKTRKMCLAIWTNWSSAADASLFLQVEKGLLSPFASPLLSPSRHLVFGQGEFTLSYLLQLLSQFSETPKASELAALRRHLALTTWTLRELSNSISGDLWDMNSSF